MSYLTLCIFDIFACLIACFASLFPLYQSSSASDTIVIFIGISEIFPQFSLNFPIICCVESSHHELFLLRNDGGLLFPLLRYI